MAITINQLNAGTMGIITPGMTKLKYTNGTVEYRNIVGILDFHAEPSLESTLEELEIGTSVTCISTDGCSDISALKIVKIPYTVTKMSHYAFANTGLTSITMYSTIYPSSQSTIEQDAPTDPTWGIGIGGQFSGCNNIENVTILYKDTGHSVSGAVMKEALIVAGVPNSGVTWTFDSYWDENGQELP